ncbi:hypothetical protein GCM10011379_32470 [Filimonas zeae]|uniref:histidine kinase n=2 Tax=Filimonas zeae TaxID=1737353 RepID=A0A917MWV2_9BACT|nr:hypothetical protein GCM10011379_32470 [Filimonas zeae]
MQSLARIIIRFSGWNAIEIRMPDIKGKEMVMASGFQKRSGPVQATFFKKTTREVQVDELRLWFEQHRMMPVCLNTAKTMETCGNGKLIVAGNHFKTVLAVPVVDKEDNSFIAAIFLLDTKEHPRNNDIKIILSHISALLGGALHKKAIQQELLNVFNHSADLIAVQDMDGRFISVNAACNNILGYSEAVLLQKRLTDLVHPDDHGLTSSAFELLKQQEQLTYENRIQSADARYKLIEWVAVSDVTIGKVFSIGRDKTDLSHTREKLRKISWSHSHIIRSPLANIIGMLHLIQQEKLTYDEKTASYLQLLEQQAQEMDTAIRNAVYDDDTAQQL